MYFSNHCWLPSEVVFEQNLKELREFSVRVCREFTITNVAKQHESGRGEMT